jgi:hypothetical protein
VVSQLKVNEIIKQSGSSITIGGSGDTVQLGTGATQSGFGGTNTPSFYVRLSSNFDLTNDTFVKVPWDTEQFDTDSAFASNKFTVPTGKGGKYFFLVHAFLGNQLGLYNIKLYKNGSAISPNTNFSHQNRSTADANMSQISIQVQDLSAGDYIEVYIQTTAGSNGDVLSSTSFFQGFKLI